MPLASRSGKNPHREICVHVGPYVVSSGIATRKQTGNPIAPDIRVMIRNAQGKYLAQDDYGLFFTADRFAAMVFSYRADNVADQLALLQKTQDVVLVAEPVPPEEIYERCDRCQDLFMPWMTYFDGRQFLCEECRGRRAGVRRIKWPKS